jgi:hypothetical protein
MSRWPITQGWPSRRTGGARFQQFRLSLELSACPRMWDCPDRLPGPAMVQQHRGCCAVQANHTSITLSLGFQEPHSSATAPEILTVGPSCHSCSHLRCLPPLGGAAGVQASPIKAWVHARQTPLIAPDSTTQEAACGSDVGR